VVVPPPAAIAPAPPPIVPPAPPPAPPVSWTEEIEDLEGDPPPLDETGSRLDLARAYIEMGDPAAARAELEIVMKQGDDGQRLLARRLIESLRR
jgi:pilus assembly protein FimV